MMRIIDDNVNWLVFDKKMLGDKYEAYLHNTINMLLDSGYIMVIRNEENEDGDAVCIQYYYEDGGMADIRPQWITDEELEYLNDIASKKEKNK